MLDSTLVMVTSEFGRTPKVNENAGRDHWARVYSQVLAGGGIAKGQIYGGINATAGEPDRDPVPVENLLATVYHQMRPLTTWPSRTDSLPPFTWDLSLIAFSHRSTPFRQWMAAGPLGSRA